MTQSEYLPECLHLEHLACQSMCKIARINIYLIKISVFIVRNCYLNLS